MAPGLKSALANSISKGRTREETVPTGLVTLLQLDLEPGFGAGPSRCLSAFRPAARFLPVLLIVRQTLVNLN